MNRKSTLYIAYGSNLNLPQSGLSCMDDRQDSLRRECESA